jgi:hypothetical protein
VVPDVVMPEGACHDLAGANGARDLVIQDTPVAFDDDCNMMILRDILALLSAPMMTRNQFRVLL